MAGGANAADFNRQLAVTAKDLKGQAASGAAVAARPERRNAADTVRAYELVCVPFGDSLADVVLNPESMRVTYSSGRSETYFFDKETPFVMDTPASVFLAKSRDSQNFLGVWDKSVLFGITGYGPGLNISAHLAMGGMVYPLTCSRRW